MTSQRYNIYFASYKKKYLTHSEPLGEYANVVWSKID